MNEPILYPIGNDAVMGYTACALKWRGITVSEAPSPEVTHILLPLPKSEIPHHLMPQFSPQVTIIGGNLKPIQYPCIDLLKDEQYLSQNAMITAQIAVNLAANHLPIVLRECPVLILGWGRIGKCLMKLLTALGSDVTVAARKPSDRAMITALGCQATDVKGLSHILRRFRIIFNTIPFPVLDANQCTNCRSDCIKIELASKPGIFGPDIIQARGLPGKYAPESSGKLIAQTIQRLLIQEEVSP